MDVDARAQIILGRFFLDTMGCKVDAKKGRLTFDVGEHHVEFSLFKDHEFSPSSLACCGCEVLASDESVGLVDLCHNDPQVLDCIYLLRVMDLIVRR